MATSIDKVEASIRTIPHTEKRIKRIITLHIRDSITFFLSSEDLLDLKRYIAELKKKYIISKEITKIVSGLKILPISVPYIKSLKSEAPAKDRSKDKRKIATAK